MKREPEHVRNKRSLKYLVLDGSFWSVMEGFTSSFITPFALFLKASNLTISILTSVPELLASFFQLLAIKINEHFSSRKKFLVAAVFIQALLWLPIMFIPLVVNEDSQALALVVLYSLVVMFGTFASPLWRGLVGDLVPEDQRGAYFSRRNKIIAVISFISSITAGFVLQHFSVRNPVLGFVILFTVALVARIISGIYIALAQEKPMHKLTMVRYKSYNYTLRRFVKDLTRTDFGKFVLFVCLFRIAVAFSQPFYSVYDLKFLGFSYMQYTFLICAEIIGSVATLGFWGKLNDEHGSKLVLMISGFMIPITPLLYLISPNYFWIMFICFFSGLAWAGFNLSLGNFMFDASSPQERVKYASYYQLFHGISVFIGALGGGLFASMLPDTKASLLAIFAISSIGRFAVALMLLPSLREMRLIELPFGKSFFEYPLIVKPRHNFVNDPFDYYLAYPNKPKRPRPRLYIDAEFIETPRDKREEIDESLSNKRFVDRMLGKDEVFNQVFKNKKK